MGMLFGSKEFQFWTEKIFFCCQQYFWALAGAGRKGRQGIWDFLNLVISTWALLVSCLPKEHFSTSARKDRRSKKEEEFVQQEKLYSDLSGDHSQGSNVMQKQRKKLLLVASSVLFRKAQKQPSENTGIVYLTWFLKWSEHFNGTKGKENNGG